MSRKLFPRRRAAAGTNLAHELLGYAAIAAMLGLFALQAKVELSPDSGQRMKGDIFFGYSSVAMSISSSSYSCGNGTVDPGETCDGGDFMGDMCQFHGFDSGFLTCDGSCQTQTYFCEYASSSSSSSSSAPYCGDAVCGITDDNPGGENSDNCSTDCPESCGDSYCSALEDSDQTTTRCESDCGPFNPYCGDNVCGITDAYPGGENSDNCTDDCPLSCGDSYCAVVEENDNSPYTRCESDCGPYTPFCGDDVCGVTIYFPAGENNNNCPMDCTVACGDNYCSIEEDADLTETRCTADCNAVVSSSEQSSSVASSISSSPQSSSASSDPCGNGDVDPGEACDGSDFGPGQDGQCSTYDPMNYDSGTLTCLMDCTAVDVTGCMAEESSSSSSEQDSSESSVADSSESSDTSDSSPASSSVPASSSEPASSEAGASSSEDEASSSQESSSAEAESSDADFSTFSASLPIDPPAGCRYSIDARIYWPSGDGDNADLDLYVANDTDDVVIHYDDMNGGGLTLNRNAHPNCDSTPGEPEIVAGYYADGEDRDFRAWYGQFSDCAPDVSAVNGKLVVRNMGQETINVNGNNVAYGQSATISIVQDAGYDVGNAAAFTGGAVAAVKCGLAPARCGDGIIQAENNEQCDPPGVGTCDAQCHNQTGGGGIGGGNPPPPPPAPAASSPRSSSRSSSLSSSQELHAAAGSSASAFTPLCCEIGKPWEPSATCGGVTAFQVPKQLRCEMPENPSCNECSLCGHTALSVCTQAMCNGIGNGSCTFRAGGPLAWFGVGSCEPAPGVCPNVVWCCVSGSWDPMTMQSCTEAGGSAALGATPPSFACPVRQ